MLSCIVNRVLLEFPGFFNGKAFSSLVLLFHVLLFNVSGYMLYVSQQINLILLCNGPKELPAGCWNNGIFSFFYGLLMLDWALRGTIWEELEIVFEGFMWFFCNYWLWYRLFQKKRARYALKALTHNNFIKFEKLQWGMTTFLQNYSLQRTEKTVPNASWKSTFPSI